MKEVTQIGKLNLNKKPNSSLGLFSSLTSRESLPRSQNLQESRSRSPLNKIRQTMKLSQNKNQILFHKRSQTQQITEEIECQLNNSKAIDEEKSMTSILKERKKQLSKDSFQENKILKDNFQNDYRQKEGLKSQNNNNNNPICIDSTINNIQQIPYHETIFLSGNNSMYTTLLSRSNSTETELLQLTQLTQSDIQSLQDEIICSKQPTEQKQKQKKGEQNFLKYENIKQNKHIQPTAVAIEKQCVLEFESQCQELLNSKQPSIQIPLLSINKTPFNQDSQKQKQYFNNPQQQQQNKEFKVKRESSINKYTQITGNNNISPVSPNKKFYKKGQMENQKFELTFQSCKEQNHKEDFSPARFRLSQSGKSQNFQDFKNQNQINFEKQIRFKQISNLYQKMDTPKEQQQQINKNSIIIKRQNSYQPQNLNQFEKEEQKFNSLRRLPSGTRYSIYSGSQTERIESNAILTPFNKNSNFPKKITHSNSSKLKNTLKTSSFSQQIEKLRQQFQQNQTNLQKHQQQSQKENNKYLQNNINQQSQGVIINLTTRRSVSGSEKEQAFNTPKSTKQQKANYYRQSTFSKMKEQTPTRYQQVNKDCKQEFIKLQIKNSPSVKYCQIYL